MTATPVQPQALNHGMDIDPAHTPSQGQAHDDRHVKDQFFNLSGARMAPVFDRPHLTRHQQEDMCGA
jgi:hypothetical protein